MAFNERVELRGVKIGARPRQDVRLGLGQRAGAVVQELADNAGTGAFQLGSGNQLMDESNALGLCGIEAFAGQRVAAQLTHPDGIDELRDNNGGRQPVADFGDRKHRVVCRNHDITGRDDTGPAAEAAPLNEGDGGNRRMIEPLNRDRGRARCRQIVLWRCLADGVDPFQVGAGLEMSAIALKDDSPQLLASLELIKRCEQPDDELIVVCIVHRRSIEYQSCNSAPVDVQQDAATGGNSAHRWSPGEGTGPDHTGSWPGPQSGDRVPVRKRARPVSRVDSTTASAMPATRSKPKSTPYPRRSNRA